ASFLPVPITQQQAGLSARKNRGNDRYAANNASLVDATKMLPWQFFETILSFCQNRRITLNSYTVGNQSRISSLYSRESVRLCRACGRRVRDFRGPFSGHP